METNNDKAVTDYSPLFNRIDDAIENYIRHGAVCEFEGQPMVYAATLLEIGNLLGEVAPNKNAAQPSTSQGDAQSQQAESDPMAKQALVSYQQGRAAGLEEAAKLCEAQNDTDWPTPLGCAHAIRALKK